MTRSDDDAPLEISAGHSTAQQQLLVGGAEEEQYRVYPLRWLVLFTFALLTITNALLWICFAPIQDLAAAYYSVSNTWINMLSVAFMALYLPGYFLAFWAMSKHGLRWGLCLAALLQTLGAIFRLLSVIGEKVRHAHPHCVEAVRCARRVYLLTRSFHVSLSLLLPDSPGQCGQVAAGFHSVYDRPMYGSGRTAHVHKHARTHGGGLVRRKSKRIGDNHRSDVESARNCGGPAAAFCARR